MQTRLQLTESLKRLAHLANPTADAEKVAKLIDTFVRIHGPFHCARR